MRVTSAGKQRWWDWKVDETFYPGWSQLVADLEAQGARMLVYIILFSASKRATIRCSPRPTGRVASGKADGTPYLIKNTSFFATLVDLSNPQARAWIKGVIKTELITRPAPREG